MWITSSKIIVSKIIFAILLMISITNPAIAGHDFTRLHGLWHWTGTEIEVRVGNCSYNPDKICAIIASGEKEGSYILKSLYKEGNKTIGKMIHPIDGRSYQAEIKILGTGKVSISGCAAGHTDCQDSIWERKKQ